MNDGVVSPPRPSADQTRTRGTATVINLHSSSNDDKRPQPDRVRTLEKVFEERLNNLIFLAACVEKPSESPRANCAAISLVFGLWQQMKGEQSVFDRAKLLDMPKPYFTRNAETSPAKYRLAIELSIPWITVKQAGDALIEIEHEWKAAHAPGKTLKAFGVERQRLLETSLNGSSPVYTVQLFNFLFELTAPLKA